MRKTLKKLHKKVQETEGKTRSFIQEILTNLLVIKAFAVDEKVNETTDELQNDNFKARMTKRNFSICANVGLGSIFSIGTVFAIAFGAYGILFKAMTYGTVTAIIQLVNQVQSPLFHFRVLCQNIIIPLRQPKDLWNLMICLMKKK